MAAQACYDLIRSHIASSGFHVTHVLGSEVPRFGYTVGLTQAGLPELVLGGAALLSLDEAGRALNAATATAAARDGTAKRGSTLDVDGVGTFGLADVDPSWTAKLLLGALDYYDRDDVPALQLVPEESLRTIDVPDMSAPYDPEGEPVWRWLTEEWPFAVSPSSKAVTNLDALHGHAVTDAGRWEVDEWELFSGAGPDVPKDEVRVAPLSTLLGYDGTLEPVTRLDVGKALWRDYLGPWQPWGD